MNSHHHRLYIKGKRCIDVRKLGYNACKNELLFSRDKHALLYGACFGLRLDAPPSLRSEAAIHAGGVMHFYNIYAILSVLQHYISSQHL